MFYERPICLTGMQTVTNGREIWKSGGEIRERRYGQIIMSVLLMGTAPLRADSTKENVNLHGSRIWKMCSDNPD